MLCSNIDLFPNGLPAFVNLYKTVDGVFHIIKISGRSKRSQANLPFSSQKLHNNCWNHCARRLSGAICIKGPDNRYRQLEGTIKGFCQPVCDFSSRIRRLPLKGMMFINWYILRCAIHLRCRCNEYPLNLQFPRRLQNVQRSSDVCIHIGIRRMVAEWNCNQRRQMKNCLTFPHSLFDTMRIADIALEYLNMSHNFRRKRIQPSPVIKRVIINKCLYLKTRFNQFLR